VRGSTGWRPLSWCSRSRSASASGTRADMASVPCPGWATRRLRPPRQVVFMTARHERTRLRLRWRRGGGIPGLPAPGLTVGRGSETTAHAPSDHHGELLARTHPVTGSPRLDPQAERRCGTKHRQTLQGRGHERAPPLPCNHHHGKRGENRMVDSIILSLLTNRARNRSACAPGTAGDTADPPPPRRGSSPDRDGPAQPFTTGTRPCWTPRPQPRWPEWVQTARCPCFAYETSYDLFSNHMRIKSGPHRNK
jgi:hypothetical protein